jgi:hypothetical protein
VSNISADERNILLLDGGFSFHGSITEITCFHSRVRIKNALPVSRLLAFSMRKRSGAEAVSTLLSTGGLKQMNRDAN